MNKKIILITGSKGMVGTAFRTLESLYCDNYEFIFHERKDCDLTKSEQVRVFFKYCKLSKYGRFF